MQSTNGIPESRVMRDIYKILSTKKYAKLSEPYFHPEYDKYTTRSSRKVIEYCDLLKQLVLDKALWEKFHERGDYMHCTRVQYEIVGNVLKAILTIHEKSKRLFLYEFKKTFVKMFTFPSSNVKVKVVILKHINNVSRILSNRLPLPDLRIRSTRSRAPADVLAAENEAFNAVMNNSGRVANQVQDTIEGVPTVTSAFPRVQPVVELNEGNVPALTAGFPPNQQRRHSSLREIEINLEEEQRKYWERAHRIEIYQEEPHPPLVSASSPIPYEVEQRLRFLRECGIGDENFRHIRDITELDQLLNRQFDLPVSNIPPVRSTRRLSEESDDTPRIFQTIAEVHPIPPQFLSPLQSSKTTEAEENLVHGIGLNANIQTPGIRPIIDRPITSTITEEIQPVFPGNLQVPVLPISENMVTEQTKRTSTQAGDPILEMNTAGPSRPTVAELLAQGMAIEEVPPEVKRAIEKRRPIVKLPSLDIPTNLPQSAPVPPADEELVYINIPPKNPPVKRKKYTFHSNLVIYNKLNKDLKPKNYVTHADRLRNEIELCRHPSNRYMPFDKYEHDEDNLDFFCRYDVERGPVPTCADFMDNLLCQLFEENEFDEDGDRFYDDEIRVENLRASLGALMEPDLRLSRNLFRQIEEQGNELPVIQTQAELIEEVPQIPVQIPTNIPQKDALQIPVAESRTSLRALPNVVPNQTRGSIGIEEPLEINLQPIDNRMPIVPAQNAAEHVSQISPRTLANLPQIETASLQKPVPEQPSTSSRISMIQPTIQALAVEVDTAGPVVERVIPQKSSGRAVDEIIDISQLAGTPAELERQQRQQSSLLPRTDPLTGIVPPVDLEPQPTRRTPLEFPESALMEAVNAELERLQMEGISLETVPRSTIAPMLVEEYVPPKRTRIRITCDDVMDMLSFFWQEESNEPINLSMLCPEDSTDKFTVASVFSILLRLAGMKKIVLHQEQPNWSPDTVWIFPPGTIIPEPEYVPLQPNDTELENDNAEPQSDYSERQH